MSFGIDDDGEQNQFDGNSQDDGRRYRIADVWDVKRLLYDEVDNAHEYPVETENDHGADRDINDELGSDLVSAAP